LQRAVRALRDHIPARLLGGATARRLSDRGGGRALAPGADRGRRLSRRGGFAARLPARAALGLQPRVPGLRARPHRWRARRSSDAQRRVHSGERGVGRRVGLPAVRRHDGPRDDHAAARVSGPSGGVRRPLSDERSARRERHARRARRSAVGARLAAENVSGGRPALEPAGGRSRPHLLGSAGQRFGGLRLGPARAGEPAYFDAALRYAAEEPVTPWMGQDTARHYEWYPWHNNGHYEIWRAAGAPDSASRVVAEYYRRGLEAVVGRARNGFRIGV